MAIKQTTDDAKLTVFLMNLVNKGKLETALKEMGPVKVISMVKAADDMGLEMKVVNMKSFGNSFEQDIVEILINKLKEKYPINEYPEYWV